MQVQHAACIMVVRPLKRVTSRRAAQGQVLNQTSAWWMEATQHIVPNALLAVPDPNVSIMRKCSVFPVEFVVRGFMTGAASGLPKHLLTGWPAGSLLSRQNARDVAKASSHVSSHSACIAGACDRQHRHVTVDPLRCWRAGVLRQHLS